MNELREMGRVKLTRIGDCIWAMILERDDLGFWCGKRMVIHYVMKENTKRTGFGGERS